METNRSKNGFALLCDAEGSVLEVLAHPEGSATQVPVGAPFSSIVAAEHRQSAQAFFAAARERGAAFDWKVSLRSAQEVRFSAVRQGEHICVIGTVFENDMREYFERLLEVHNDQINEHRNAVKEGNLRDRMHRDREVRMLEDITRLNNELVSAQRELARKNAALERLNEEKNTFLGMAAHDVRSPLGTIVMYSDWLIEKLAPKLTAEQLEMLSEIRWTGELALDLVDDFLDVASIEAGKLRLRTQEVDLAELIKLTLKTNRALAHAKGIEIQSVQKDALPPVRIDPGKIQQVLDNLISNAVKYSSSGSVVEITLRKEDDCAAVDVTDNGPGIPADEMDQLFQPFGRTSVQSTGGEKSTGLGLLIVKRIVEGHGGRVRAESVSGKGTMVTLLLPLHRSTSEAARPATVDEEKIPDRAALNILLVEDNPGHRMLGQQLLERMGDHVTTAADGNEALAEIGRRSYDVVLMDLEMPGMSGLDTSRQIREHGSAHHQPHIIAVTARSGLVAQKECEAAGMDDFVEKPTTFRKLEAALKQVRLQHSSRPSSGA